MAETQAPPTLNCIERVFGRPRVLLPVIHLPHEHVGAIRAVKVARDAGADGVFLIAQGMHAKDALHVAACMRDDVPGFWVGVNLLGHWTVGGLADTSESLHVDGYWADDAGVDALDVPTLERAQQDVAWAREPREFGGPMVAWSGLYFGGVAFKTQAEVPDALLPVVAKRAATFVDVVTTSGPETGVPPRLRKIQILREAMGAHPLAIASGITPENVEPYLPYVDAFLVASGIESSFGVLDPARTKALADKIHAP